MSARGQEERGERGEAPTSVAVLRNVTIFDVAKLGEHGHELVAPAMERNGGTRARKKREHTESECAREARGERGPFFLARNAARALRLGVAQGGSSGRVRV